MAIDLLAIALDFLAQYGLLAVFVLLVMDGALLLPVLPGEVIMIMAVTQYAETLDDLVLLVALATGAAMVGSLLLYGICRVGGRPLVERYPRLFMMSPRRRERLERAFQKPVGQSLVMFLRIIPLTRVLVNIPAGLARMGLGRFVVLSAIGMTAFHAGFMWLAFEFRQPGSGVAQQAAALQAAYASPAWDYMQANQVITGLGVLALAAVVSFRASRRVLKDPEGEMGSLIGWLTARILFWGGIAVAVTLYVDRGLLFELSEAGGLDLIEAAARFNTTPLSLVAIAAATSFSLGLILISMGKAGARRRRRVKLLKKRERERDRVRERIRNETIGGRTPRPTGREDERVDVGEGPAVEPQPPDETHDAGS